MPKQIGQIYSKRIHCNTIIMIPPQDELTGEKKKTFLVEIFLSLLHTFQYCPTQSITSRASTSFSSNMFCPICFLAATNSICQPHLRHRVMSSEDQFVAEREASRTICRKTSCFAKLSSQDFGRASSLCRV